MKMNGLKHVLEEGKTMNEQEICAICGSQIVEKFINHQVFRSIPLMLLRVSRLNQIDYWLFGFLLDQ